MRNFNVAGLALSAILVTGAGAQAATITIADPGYATAQATAFVVKAVLEDRLGTDVKIVNAASVPVIWEALARDTGDIDVWTDVWLPNQAAAVEQYVTKAGAAKLSPLFYAGTQGYCVTKSAAEQGVKSVYDLADPDKAKLFDAKGDGKGQIWLGASGWLSTQIEKVRARDYGFADFFDLETTDEAIATASLDKASKDGKGWIGYCYGPHQNFARYELVHLQEPAHDDKTFTFVNPKDDPAWFEKSAVKSAYKDAEIHIAYSKSVADRAPEVARLLERVQFDTQTVSQLAFEIAVNKKTPDEAARAWVKAHPDLVAKWQAP
ncbi:hypothetical protein FZC33_06255 [Labrys sp. KNU-23]|uniref:ABC transporter substrate-binding protein n=1 Tax=Labrys sp. KNU-23 TaxID=2789216 RepID=UPI0011EC1B4B|nr:glycine betaine ABC transporter substrate-binding protein [Labrys sp. KNU-23]QEN85831.1 hypothetical protein FZC33_06255 [Labrys sp. KNU-23]